MGYGGPAADYTLRQHEDSSISHRVGEDHWLEKAFNRHSQKALDDAAKAADSVLR
jgi:hypothetical protein